MLIVAAFLLVCLQTCEPQGKCTVYLGVWFEYWGHHCVGDVVKVVCGIQAASPCPLGVLVRLRSKQLTEHEVRWPLTAQMMLYRLSFGFRLLRFVRSEFWCACAGNKLTEQVLRWPQMVQMICWI
jgi:hypothetical protein